MAEALPPAMLPVLSTNDLERIRIHLKSWPHREPRLRRDEYLGAIGVFLLIFLSTLPVVLPFLISTSRHLDYVPARTCSSAS